MIFANNNDLTQQEQKGAEFLHDNIGLHFSLDNQKNVCFIIRG